MKLNNSPSKVILETSRLFLREMTSKDFSHLCRTLQDEKAMYAYEHAFSDEEVLQWLDKQVKNYNLYGFGLWAIIAKDSGDFIGQAGLTRQQGLTQSEIEIGYLLERKHWHWGFATEAAEACKYYAFHTLHQPKVVSIIRDNNYPSQRVAERIGMTIEGAVIKHYYQMDMPHWIYSIQKEAGA